MDSRRLSFPVDRPRVHSAGLSLPPPLLITTTTSPLACLRRRRLVPPPTRLAYYAAAVGRLRLHRRPASVAADWCPRLYGWLVTPPFMGVHVFTAGLPPSPPSGASAYTAGLLCRRCWVSMTSPPACLRRRRLVPPPTRLACYAAAVGRLRLHRRPASVAADWCPRLYGWLVTPPFMGVHVFTAGLPPSLPTGVLAYMWCLRLHGWPIMPPLLGVYDFTAGLPPPPPIGASAYTAGLLCRRCWASMTSPPACLRRRRLVPPPTRLAYYAAAVGRLRLHRRPASVAADWCPRLYGWLVTPPFMGVYDFTAGLPPSPPTGVLAYTVGWSHHRSWASTSSPPVCLRRRRLVPPPTRLAYYAAAVGRLRLHRRPASVAADRCLRLHGWPIMPPLLGVYDFTAGLPPSPPTGVLAYTVGWSHHRSWASTSSPPVCLRRRRLVPPPTRLAYYAAAVGRLRRHRRPASVAADWCPRLYGWLVTPPFMGVHVFTAGLPPSPPIGASAYTAGLLCRRCWASTTSPPACLRRRRLVSSPIRLVGHTTVHGRPRLHRRSASVAADWCLRLHGWPIMPPLLGVYDFTAGLPPSPPIAYYAAAVGRLRLHRRPASVAADWCPRLYGWLVTPPFMGVHVFADRLAFATADWCFCLYGWQTSPPLMGFIIYTTGLVPLAPTGVFVTIDGLLRSHIGHFCCHRGNITKLTYLLRSRNGSVRTSPPARLDRRRLVFPPARLAYYATVVGRLRLHRPACLRRRRLVFPPARLAYYATVVGRLRLHRPAASSAADWCHRLHGWPIMPPLLGVYVFTDRLAFAAADWCFRLHGWPIMPPLLGVYVFTDRPPRPPPTGASACTAGLYAAVVGRLRLHRPAASTAADWCFRLHGWPIMPPLLGVYVFTDRPPPADWCFRLHGWPIMPPLLGVYVFTDRLAFAAADWCFRLHGWPTMPPLLDVYVFTDRPPPADWCFRLHGWPIMPPLLGVYVFTDRPPRPPPTGVSACTLAYYAIVDGRLRLHRPACLRRHRLVSPSARLAYYAVVVGRLRLHHRPASIAADWCFRLHGWPIMPSLMGVCVFTDRLAFAAADWCLRLHGWPIMPPLMGVCLFTDRLAFAATDWCFRLHGWPIMPPLLGVYVFTDRLAFAAADWCFRLHG
uniref:cysteine dioxygenase n=1 Tax=Oryza sativa subsp. japonica TaxID=39947 RepID=Q60E10_ORYSJ|nr:hypothetical protein [Oryza sativa Japonica Group]